jgi:endogenous inhibitor of DNA gyrase (YacG/DUF329 family)
MQSKNNCVICKTEMPGPWLEYPDFPFCSKRCRLIDLGRWLNEDYKVAKPKPEDESSEVEA